jgi:hypothetical protein
MEIFDMSILPVYESGVHVTKEYVLDQLYCMDSYLHMPPKTKEENKISPRSKECGSSKWEFARNSYLMGITQIPILEHGCFAGGGPAKSDQHEGPRWKQIYGIPFDLFFGLSDQVEEWLKAKNKTTRTRIIIRTRTRTKTRIGTRERSRTRTITRPIT